MNDDFLLFPVYPKLIALQRYLKNPIEVTNQVLLPDRATFDKYLFYTLSESGRMYILLAPR